MRHFQPEIILPLSEALLEAFNGLLAQLMLVGALPDHTCMPILHASWPRHHSLISSEPQGCLGSGKVESCRAGTWNVEPWREVHWRLKMVHSSPAGS